MLTPVLLSSGAGILYNFGVLIEIRRKITGILEGPVSVVKGSVSYGVLKSF